jgi:hypothetical protein
VRDVLLRQGQGGGGPGAIVLKQTEHWADISLPDPTKDNIKGFHFTPGGSNLAHLDTMAHIYERYRIVSASVHYRPSVGATKDGTVTIAAEWDAANDPTTLKGLYICQPVANTPVSKAVTINLPAHRLMQQKYLKCTGTKAYDTTSFSIFVGGKPSAAIVPGTLWCTYHVILEGPRLAAS